MTDAKNPVSETRVVISDCQMAADVTKRRNTKKYVIITVVVIIAAAIVLTTILVGMYMSTQGEKELLKFTLNVNKDTKEEVTVDENENIVQYHVQNANYEIWVVDDYNRDIELMKTQTDTDTNCYIVPLNRTRAPDVSQVKDLLNADIKQNFTERPVYGVASNPVADSSFLSKTATELCKGISVYWMYPKCSGGLEY